MICPGTSYWPGEGRHMGCPNCGKPCTYSEHAFFHYDVLAAKCFGCRLYTVVGADRWVRFPTHPCTECYLGMPHECELADPKAADRAFWAAHHKAQDEWTALAKEVHARQRPVIADITAPPAYFVIAGDAPDRRPEPDPPEPAETWRDRAIREPML